MCGELLPAVPPVRVHTTEPVAIASIGDIKHHVLGISSYHTSTIDHTMFDL